MTNLTDRSEGIEFTPDESVHVHEEGAIRLICAAFRSHEDGLPEWIKNSSDMYTRRDAVPSASVIVVLLQDGVRGSGAMVGCLDFGGMSTADIEQRFRNWADPDAAGDVPMTEGGHGNGGKCYMTQLFGGYSYIHTLYQGRGNRYGFKGGSFKPGYFPSPAQSRGYKVDDSNAELEQALKPFRLTVADLPKAAQTAWKENKGFTLVLGVGAKQLSRNRIPARQWMDKLRGHQQMVRSLQRNEIFVFHNGEVQHATPLKLEEIRPIPGAESPRTISIPAGLPDPDTGDTVDTGAVEGKSRLVLRTSDVSMRWSLKPRHTINGWTHDGRSTGYWEVPALSRQGYSEKIYGDVYLDELAEYKQNDRRNHSDAPLTRAIREWISQQIEEYCAEFVKLDRLQASKEEQAELSRLNDQLNEWKNKFLEREFGGIGEGGARGKGGKPQRPRLPRGEVARVVLAISHNHAGQGVTFRPSLDFFDASGSRVRAIPFKWESSDWAVATVDEDLNMITTHAPGTVSITVVCKDSGIRSNTVMLEVLDIVSVDLSPAEMEIRAGSRLPITATVTTKDGRTLQGLYLIWTEDNADIVSVGSGGMAFGLTPGESSVAAGDNQALSTTPTRVKVLERGEKGKDGGSGFPRILLSEIDDDPLGEVPPVFSEAEPPVYQRVQDVDLNIWWINMASPLARRYIDTVRGGGSNSREWRVYLLERYIEVMVKILLTYDFTHGQDLTFETMLRRWEEESIVMQQRAAASLQGFLQGGDFEVAA